MSRAFDLVGKGFLDKPEVAALRKKLFEDKLGKLPQGRESFVDSFQTSSAIITSQIGNFAPVSSNSEEKSLEYQKETRDLTRETNKHLEKIAKQRGRSFRR